MRNIRFALAVLLVAAVVITTAVSAVVSPVNASSSAVTAARSNTVPNDQYYARQWALPVIASSIGVRSSGEVLVAVLDSGIDIAHEDLSGVVRESVNFSGSRSEFDVQGHGTHVAGILAARTNNSIGIAGVSSGIRLLNVKVVEDNGMVWPSNVAKGIIWAVDNGARVINMSFTMSTDSPVVAESVKYAADHGVIMFAAAGNHIDSKTYPAAYPQVIAVAALNSDGTIWNGSKVTDWIDVYVPGTEIYSTVPGNKYDYKSGSSMATAYASGMAVMLMNNHERTNSSEVRTALKSVSYTLLK